MADENFYYLLLLLYFGGPVAFLESLHILWCNIAHVLFALGLPPLLAIATDRGVALPPVVNLLLHLI